MPDIYKVSKIAKIFDVSLEALIWGECQQVTEKEIAKKIYVLFTENMESLRTCLLTDGHISNKELVTKLRAEIKRSRLLFSKRL